jgi:hypothetical protein
VRAGSCIEAAFGKAQALHGAAPDEMFVDYLLYILSFDEAVPDRLWVNDHGRTVFALVEASGLVGADPAGQTSRLDGVFELGVDLAFTLLVRAGGASAAGLAGVGADENVTLEFCQEELLKIALD